MSRRRHHSEEESSLELLLDTMCNTFGGVMFIAISLFIIISAFPLETAENSSAPPVEENDPVKLQEELERLQDLLVSKQQERQLLEEELKQKQASPWEHKVRELALLERMVQEEELSREAKKLQLEARMQEWTQTTEALDKAKAALYATEAKKMKLESEKQRLQNELAQMRTRPVERINMEFKVIQHSQKQPFFIILDGEYAWPVGPWRKDGKDTPDSAVEYYEFMTIDREPAVSCKIRPGKGIRVLLPNGEMTPEFQKLLSSIPNGRVPDFYIHSTAAATVSRMREILKRSNKIHGSTPAKNDTDDFVYQYTKVDYYEY